jgi:hypothetical protein
LDDSYHLKSVQLKDLWQAGLIFSVLALVLIPGPLDLLGWQKSLADFVVLPLLKFLGGLVLPTEIWFQEISSDSNYMWLMLVVLLPTALIGTWFFAGFRQSRKEGTTALLQILLTYFLAFVLLNYGLDKVFKAQFYLPEPNILFTPFGMLDKDILYWSTMGVSYEYNFFLGLAEVIAAFLIIVRKTRVFGLLIGVAILINVIAVNFSFDISVKAFSMLLLLISLLLLAPFARSFIGFFLERQPVRMPELARLSFARLSGKPKSIIKILLVGMVLIEALYPYWKAGTNSDDLAERPFLHGAYKIIESSDTNLRMVFIHRDGYLIFQDEELRMKDYKLEVNLVENYIELTDYDGSESNLDFEYYQTTGKLELKNREGSFYLSGKAINWREMPALKRQLHWSVD